MPQKFARASYRAVLSVTAFTQATPTAPTVVQAERMLLLLFSDPVNGTNYISSVGLSDADNSVIASDAATLATIYNSAVTNYNAGIVPPGYSDPLSGLIGIRDSAVQSAMTDIQNKLSQQGTQDWTTFNAFLTDAQNNEMGAGNPPSDLVAVRKFTSGGGWIDTIDGGGLWAGAIDTISVDGSPGQPNSCTVIGNASQQFVGGNNWSTIGAAPANTTQMVSAYDGTLLARTSANGLYMLGRDNAFHQLSGAGKEITGSATGGIYTVGTDSRLYALNTATNAWVLASGAGYPFTTVSHVTAGGPDYSVFVSNGTTVAAHIPGTSPGWVTIGTAPSAPVSMTTYFTYVPNATQQQWGAYFIGANGQFYFAWYQGGSKGFTTNLVGFTGYTGTPTDLHFNADQSFVLRTTTGVFQTQSQGSVFAPITGQTGSVASSDSVNSVYLVNTAGNLVRFFPSNTVYATYAGFGNQYVQMVNPDILNNLPNMSGFSFGSNGSASVVAWCRGAMMKLLNFVRNEQGEVAYTRVKAVGNPYDPYDCSFGMGISCAYWSTINWCIDTPDSRNLSIVHDTINPVPWGWDVWQDCFSPNGHAPWTCGAISTFLPTGEKLIGPQTIAACTSNP